MIDTPVDHTPLARMGRWAHSHRRLVFVVWAVMALGLGVFAPKLEHALSGAMWEVKGSESLAAREIIDEQFGGLVRLFQEDLLLLAVAGTECVFSNGTAHHNPALAG